ncbi:type I restriction enzyme HsdR N-terminal domain-containing protein [Sediminitomix flava]|uniref:Type I restriction and modification enzyme subunit R-like protein n=1 Tax=Sediminitomix flava TaxID=379075 RepID=A0A315ZHN8_SEDFL|nr:type I restriction enzyme HsdR N-terminal domain-containing protein [Sediminitomix flava]PWJ45041.1 type I restriction and modification enzyme subunit R-like protein [Sediminitomix flava]
MKRLNLPHYDYKLQRKDDKVWILDQIRKKYLVLTPEEWVRQHFINFLITEGYPKSLIGVEGGLKVNQMQKRSDILVYDRKGKPFLLVECKAPEVKLSNKTFEQAAAYNSVLKAPFLIITNGLQHFVCKINFENGSYDFLDGLPQFPPK